MKYLKYTLVTLMLIFAGCTRYQAKISIPILDPNNVVIAHKEAQIGMFYFLQRKAFKLFTIDPNTGALSLENFGTETSQIAEVILDKIPIP